jgi:acyl-CoA reductase-like NAD-dependent aldehyde dehydrogenase
MTEAAMPDTPQDIRRIVEEVLSHGDVQALFRSAADAEAPATGAGIARDIDTAVRAASAAQRELGLLPLETRRGMIDAMRRTVLECNESLSTEAVIETGLGNVRDKQVKNALAANKTPGVEDVEPSAYSDEHGLTIMERAPYGVIGAITPVTNPLATITSNSIGMIAGGNAVVFNVHPNAKKVSSRLISLLNEAIARAGGPATLLNAVASPTIETAGEVWPCSW